MVEKLPKNYLNLWLFWAPKIFHILNFNGRMELWNCLQFTITLIRLGFDCRYVHCIIIHYFISARKVEQVSHFVQSFLGNGSVFQLKRGERVGPTPAKQKHACSGDDLIHVQLPRSLGVYERRPASSAARRSPRRTDASGRGRRCQPTAMGSKRC
jgi:hypothetical protein